MSENNPIQLTKTLRDALERYIPTTLPISRRYPDLQKRFLELVREQNLVIGPYVEGLPDFEKGRPLRELVLANGGFLHDGFFNLPDSVLDRPLHLHQEQSLVAACKEKQSLIVATGTGSGKTETFLFPLANQLLLDQNPNAPGVRALLIYPMNALANDQLYYRIAPLFGDYLADYRITFGRYTSQIRAHTHRSEEEQKLKDNPKLMEALNGKIPNNWLLTREEMLANPPKILITNYAMLEHLLLLPRNAPLFAHSGLSCMVLDEIHSYSGAQATEVSFLIRKLKNRLQINWPLQVFGTSASLASGDDADSLLIHFAGSLFSEKVHKVIRGRRIPHNRLQQNSGQTFTLGPKEWIEIGRTLNELATHEDPDSSEWNEKLDECGHSIPKLDENLGVPEAMEKSFHVNEEVRRVAEVLDKGRVMEFKDLAGIIFSDPSLADADRFLALSALMHLGMWARKSPDSFPLLPSRYHMAVNGIEGVCVSLDASSEEGWSAIKPQRHYRSEDGSPFYPLLVCRRCGQPFIEGFSDGAKLYNSLKEIGDDGGGISRKIYWLGQPPQSKIQDEADEDEDQEDSDVSLCFLNPRTGTFHATRSDSSVCLTEVALKKDEVERRTYVNTCPSCGHRPTGTFAEAVTRMHPGDEALGTVVVQKVLEALPEVMDRDEPRPMQGRTLLTFADSRQDAAYFAPYFERTSGDLALRTAIYQVLRQAEEPVKLSELADLVMKHLRKFGVPVVLDAKGEMVESSTRQRDLILGLITAEFCTPGGRRNSLEALGLVRVTLEPRKLKELKKRVAGFTPEGKQSQIDSLIPILLETIRRERAISGPEDLDMKDSFIWGDSYCNHRSFELYKTNPKISHAWLTQEGSRRHNRRTKYIVENLGWEWEHGRDFLRLFWEAMLESKFLLALRPGFGMDSRLIRLSNSEDYQLYSCKSCGLMQFHIVDNRCAAFGCKGEVQEISKNERERFHSENHYAYLIREGKALTTRAREHTASLSTDLRQIIEQEFGERKVNVLSCTTTMEMGVDLGELEAVVCLNIPPGISNYQQRTGRAGRRAQAAPFCVTIARNGQYDQSVYRDFRRYLEQPAPVPRIYLANYQLFHRHQNSIVLSAFMRHRIKDLIINAPSLQSFFGEKFGDEQFQAFQEDMCAWIENSSGREALEEAQRLGSLLPSELRESIPLTGKGLQAYFQEGLEGFAREINERWNLYTSKREEFKTRDDLRRAQHWENLRTKYMDQFLVNQLSSRGMIPTYSFPVHSLNLEVTSERGGRWNFAGSDVSLTRDAALGLGEYAPGSQVVANGRIWTSEGLAYYPRDFMPIIHYFACPECQHVDISPDDEDLPKECSFCGAPRKGLRKRFVEPKGFITSYSKRSGEDPSRTRIRKQYADEARLISLARSEQFQVSDNPKISRALLRAHPTEKDGAPGEIFIVNRGPYGFGYHRCTLCNYMIPAQKVKTINLDHNEVLSDKKCLNRQMSSPIDLAHIFRTDVCLLRFHQPIPAPESELHGIERKKHYESFCRTLCEALRFAAAEALEIQAGEIRSTYKINMEYIDIIVYDAVSGGAGYSVRLSSEITMDSLLKAALRRLTCPNECTGGCRTCLCDYSNQRFWDVFNRQPVLEWLQRIAGKKNDHPVIRMGGMLWENPSYEILGKRVKTYSEIHLLGDSLLGNDNEGVEQTRKWMLDLLNNGCRLQVHLRQPLKSDSKRLPLHYRKTLSYLRSYVEDGTLLISQLSGAAPDVDAPMKLLRVFTSPAEGALMWFTDYHVAPIMENLLPKPAFQMTVDAHWAAILNDLIASSSPCPSSILKENAEMMRWQLRAGDKRDLEKYFAPISGTYVEDLVIRDPYCGAGEENRNKLVQFLDKISQIAQEIKRTRIICKELNYRDMKYEAPYEIKRKIMEATQDLNIGKIDPVVHPFKVARGLHDRDVSFKTVNKDGESFRHVFDLSGGLDYLLDERSETKIYYFVE